MDNSPNNITEIKTEDSKLITNGEKVSIIIPVYNDVKGLLDTLNALKKQNYPSKYIEIIVVDNNSTDGSDKIAANTPGIILVYEKEIQNAGAARNKGMSLATGSIFAFTDANCIPKEDWITQGVKAMQEKKADRIAGEVSIFPISFTSSAVSILDAVYNFNQKFLIETYKASVTANLFIKSSIYKKIGCFEPDFFEDIKFGRRASSMGFNLYYSSDCVVYHPPRSTLKAIWLKGIRSGKGTFSICQSENLGGWMHYKHFLRAIKLLVIPRKLYWERLPFPSHRISLYKSILIYLWLWIAVNLAETIGYIQWFSRYLYRQIFYKRTK